MPSPLSERAFPRRPERNLATFTNLPGEQHNVPAQSGLLGRMLSDW